MSESIKNDILKVIKNYRNGVSFVDLTNHVEGFYGDCQYQLADNFYIWLEISEDAIKALDELVSENKITPTFTTPLIYLHDGKMPNMPIAKKLGAYKTPHFMPTVFSYVNQEK